MNEITNIGNPLALKSLEKTLGASQPSQTIEFSKDKTVIGFISEIQKLEKETKKIKVEVKN